MQKFSVFQRSVLLAASPEEVFSFHEDPRNIRKISPPSLRVEKVACSVPARVGDEFQLTVRQFGIRLEWIGFWEEIDRGHKLTDGAIKSPFLHWRHQHRFEPAGRDAKETLMTDRVEYALREGILGTLADATLIRMVLSLMFHARHRASRKYFSSGTIGKNTN